MRADWQRKGQQQRHEQRQRQENNKILRTKTKILRKRPRSGNCQMEDCFWQDRKINISHFFLVSEFGFKTYILMCAYWVADQKPYIFIPVSGLWSNLWSVPWACHTPWPGGPRLPQQGFFENRFTMFSLRGRNFVCFSSVKSSLRYHMLSPAHRDLAQTWSQSPNWLLQLDLIFTLAQQQHQCNYQL